MRGATAGRYLACVAVAAGLVWAFGRAWRSGYPITFPDSSSYLDAADAGPFSSDLWFGQRPPTYPLLIWVVGPSPRAIVLVQLLVAVLAWGWLLRTVWQQLRSRWVAVTAIGMLALVAIQSRWAFWHSAVLTESLSGSLAIAGIAAWWRWLDRPDRFRLVGAVSLTSAWMLLRDSNAVTFAVVAFPALALLAGLERRASGPRRRGMAVALGALLVVGAFSLTGQYVSNRGETSFHNNVGLRWLPDDDMRAWMVERGMPLTPSLEERAGSDAWADGEAFLRSPFLDGYRDWAQGRGRVAAASSFVLRADWYLDRLWRELPTYTGTDHLAYDTSAIAERLPERPLGFLDPVGSRGAMTVWVVSTVAAGIAIGIRRRRLVWLVPFWTVPVLADLYLTYAADAIEVGRHLVGPMLRLAVVMILAVAIAVDAVAEPVERQNGADDRDETTERSGDDARARA